MSSHHLSSHHGGSHYLSSHYGRIGITPPEPPFTPDDVPHPPLELLFTTDEETGLTGASSLQPGFIKGKQLLNIDSEDEGVFTVGCAGGEDARLSLPFAADDSLPGYEVFKLVTGGMSGGHSGIDIIEGRAAVESRGSGAAEDPGRPIE